MPMYAFEKIFVVIISNTKQHQLLFLSQRLHIYILMHESVIKSKKRINYSDIVIPINKVVTLTFPYIHYHHHHDPWAEGP